MTCKNNNETTSSKRHPARHMTCATKALVLPLLFFGLLVSCNIEHPNSTIQQNDTMPSGKKNIGSLLALYPQPITVIGAHIDGKVNWLLVGHTGIIGHDRILVSMSQSHYTNQGIIESKKLSINLVSHDMLMQADHAGSVSGRNEDKSHLFAYHLGTFGTPVIDAAPVSMECRVEEIIRSDGFDNFVCSVINTYADTAILDTDGRPDFAKLKPILFDYTSYSYIATGPVIGKCLNLNEETSMCAKHPMAGDGIVRLSKIEVYPEYIDAYLSYATEVGEISLRTEPGVLTMYAVQEKENPCHITILETYSSHKAYERHIASPHFQKYKRETQHMVKTLVLSDQQELNPKNRINNFIE